MYPAEDILVLLRIATTRAHEIRDLIHEQLARSRELGTRVRAPRGSVPRDDEWNALFREVDEAVESGRLLAEEARRHLRNSERLVARSLAGEPGQSSP